MKYFGTDGIRGKVGHNTMTAEFALRIANAAAQVLAPDGGTVLIGKDTRISGYMFESALEAGFVSAGMDVKLLGPIPTPAIAHLIKRYKADLGIVISASHNSFADNGIKFFNNLGTKLNDEIELEIEKFLEKPNMTKNSIDLGRASIDSLARERYQEFCISTYGSEKDLSSLKIVFDAANGSGYKVGPRIFNDLGAQILSIGCSPNGKNINENCGSTHPALLQQTVKAIGADLGIALDGDGDRVLMVDEDGELLDGDQLLYILALDLKAHKKLKGPVVGTVMSNMGLEFALKDKGISFKRSNVGDRYVLEMLRDQGGNLGGETSGHMLCMDHAETGDGLITALQILSVMTRTGKSLKELSKNFKKFPQITENIKLNKEKDFKLSSGISSAIKDTEKQLIGGGRVILRPSGTEPLIRITVEGKDLGNVKELTLNLVNKVSAIIS
ncbi:MAG: phosphoglucosamine mutase [Woeseiaceae bacterium]|nr:phosphoglucosamine mutase [Woeseiaceae bacterium]MDG1865738.1 phosphoglucosamine mutase [Woeseiaceae bacterium]